MTPVNVITFDSANYQWQLEAEDKFAGFNKDFAIAYSWGLTPQLVDDPEWCVFMITPIKEIVNDTNGRVFYYSCMYGYRIQAQGRNLTPEFLYNLVVWVWESFKEHFDEKAKGTNIQTKIMDKPKFADAEKDLKMVIMMQGVTQQ